ncbi:MAG: SMI1/KNR4 family protein [Sandaracinaceae bacterium]|nr:SMI1/KNR4 family protein [Sandaracinaceae bacterium]
MKVHRAAAAKEVTALEHQLGAPLPADLKLVLGVFDGATLPNGVLLSASPGPGDTIEAALKELAAVRGVSFLDTELLLPFLRTELGSYLAFDRSAAPVSDTWPVVDYDPQADEARLIHRTFDGWCRLCVREWTAADYAEEFTVDKYLRQGERHADIEPDVSIAHVTVAHALRRAGEPERSLESYLRAGRCVPAEVWADWGGPLARRAAPLSGRRARGGPAPRQARARGHLGAARDHGLAGRLHAREGGAGAGRRAGAVAAHPRSADRAGARRRGPRRGQGHPARGGEGREGAAAEPGARGAHRDRRGRGGPLRRRLRGVSRGSLREEDLLLDPRLDALWSTHDPADVLRIRREF